MDLLRMIFFRKCLTNRANPSASLRVSSCSLWLRRRRCIYFATYGQSVFSFCCRRCLLFSFRLTMFGCYLVVVVVYSFAFYLLLLLFFTFFLANMFFFCLNNTFKTNTHTYMGATTQKRTRHKPLSLSN